MEVKTATSPEYERFTSLVDQVLAVPKAAVQRQIAEEKQTATTAKKANGKAK